METKESKAQLEVWGWKEKAYNQINDMPLGEAIEYILNQTKRTGEELDQKRKFWKKQF